MARDFEDRRPPREDERSSGGRYGRGEDSRHDEDHRHGARAPRAAMDPGFHDDFGERDFGARNPANRTFGGDLGHTSRGDDDRRSGGRGRYDDRAFDAGPRRGPESMGPGYLDRGYLDRGYPDRGHPDRSYPDGSYSDRGYGERGYSDMSRSDRSARGRDDERSWWNRASDEVSSWFGDEEAERRRERDEHRGRGPRNYARSDARILEDVSDRLSDDPYVDAREMEVRVENGEVTLEGTVDSRSAKRRAEDVAESVSGVRHCQNNLRVRRSGRAELGLATPGVSTAAPSGGTGSEQTQGSTRLGTGGTTGTSGVAGGIGGTPGTDRPRH